MQTKNNLIIISVDALNKLDYKTLLGLPTIAGFIRDGAHVKEVTSVYPTVTYTCHTSLSTGHYPSVHGIYNNELPDPAKATLQDWHWYERDIKVPTFFDYATQAGLKTATVLWPVMAGANIDYNIPEIWSPDHSISRLKLFWDYGTKNMLWPVVKYKRLLKGTTQPYLDNFSEAVSHYILKKKKPNLMAIHFTELDTMRHIHGLKSKESLKALKRIDQRIERLIQTLEKNGQLPHTNIVLLGDHGTHDFDTVIEINSLFKKEGLLTTDADNKITSWQAYACTCGGSCQIHIHEKATEDIRTKIKAVLEAFVKMPETPLRFMLTHDEASEKYNLSGDFSYILEAKDRHVFRNSASGKIIHDSKDDPDTYIGDHGFMPEHPDQKTLLLMKGPSIKKGAVLLHSHLVDEGPTFAALLGLKMEKVEGRVLEELMHL